MEVKPGYKQTDVGVIPEDWSVKPLGELFDFSGGYAASRDQLSSEGHCYLHYGDIHSAPKPAVDVGADYQIIPKLNIPLRRVSSKSLLEDGDVVFVDASEDDEGTSRHVVVVNKDKKPFISGLHTIVAKSKTDELLHDYRRYCFQTASIRRQFLFYAVGTKVTGISKSNIPKLFLPIPPPPEQRAIAEALSDVDGLLAGLDRLIAKKRGLKQAVMQKLLTGKARLPGYHGEWEEKCLGTIAQIRRGASPRPIESPVWFDENSTTGWVRISDVTKSGMFLDETAQRLSPLGVQHSRSAEAGSLIMSICATVGRPIITTINVCIHDGFVIFDNLQADKFFIYYVLKWIEPVWSKHGQTGSQMNLNTGIINATKIKLPKPAEQAAIAAVLREMDTELAALEQRSEKTNALKQALMQTLLTGKIRLLGTEMKKI